MKYLIFILLVITSTFCENVQQDFIVDEKLALGKLISNKDKHLQFNQLVDNKHEYSRHSSGSSGDDSLYEFVAGLLLFILAFPILWFNERRYVIDQYRITHAFQSCKVVDCSMVNNETHLQLFYQLKGHASTDDIIIDEQFAIAERNCIKAERRVEMYLWVESSYTDDDNNTYYTYSQEWKNHFVHSSNFNEPYGHENDELKWVVSKQTYIAPTVQLGQYIVSDSLKQQTCKYEQIQLHQNNCQIAQQQFSRSHPFMFQNIITLEGNCIMFRQYESQHISGDLKVHFVKVPCEDLSIVSEQVGNTFQPWIIHDKYDENTESLEDQPVSISCCCCYICSKVKSMETPMMDIDWIFESLLTKYQAFNKKLNDSFLKTILIRIGGWLLMVFGLYIFFSPITTIISYLPLLGNFLAAVSDLIICLFGLVLGAVCALITIAIAWLRYRPFAALVLINLSGALSVGIYMWTKSHQ